MNKEILKWTGVFFVTTLVCFAIFYAIALGQAAPPYAGVKSGLQWTAPTENEDGSALLDLDHYVVAISTEDLAAGGTALATKEVTCGEPTCQTVLSDLVATLPDGTYKAWARTVDHAGNESVWSAPVEFQLDKTVPKPPVSIQIWLRLQ
jgi:hypothetical protein